MKNGFDRIFERHHCRCRLQRERCFHDAVPFIRPFLKGGHLKGKLKNSNVHQLEHPFGPGLPLQRWGHCDGSSKHGPLVPVMIGL